MSTSSLAQPLLTVGHWTQLARQADFAESDHLLGDGLVGKARRQRERHRDERERTRATHDAHAQRGAAPAGARVRTATAASTASTNAATIGGSAPDAADRGRSPGLTQP